jgi:hypothetical protein
MTRRVSGRTLRGAAAGGGELKITATQKIRGYAEDKDEPHRASRQSSNSSFGFFDHTFQSGYLPKEFYSRLRGTAE